MSSYIYPVLSNIDFGFFRLGGAGLANNMFVVSRAWLLSRKHCCTMLRPTWEHLSIGPYLRREHDKRHYCGLFRRDGVVAEAKKLWLLHTRRHIREVAIDFSLSHEVIVRVEGLGNYFQDLIHDPDEVRSYFKHEIKPSALSQVPKNLSDYIAIHIRLGDYPAQWRIDLSWYCGIIESLQKQSSKFLKFLLFSDGNDTELSTLLKLPGVSRSFYGNALADIIGISRCSMLIGSDSTFSGWGAYLGQMPSIFNRSHYGCMLKDPSMFLLTGDSTIIPTNFVQILKNRQIL